MDTDKTLEDIFSELGYVDEDIKFYLQDRYPCIDQNILDNQDSFLAIKKTILNDFLDDVSGRYKTSSLGSFNDAVKNPDDPNYALANRSPEIQTYLKDGNATANKAGVNYNTNLPYGANYDQYFDSKQNKTVGSLRGSNADKDGYFLLNITAGYVLKGKNKYYQNKYRNIANRRKVVKKKTRAKF